MSLVKEAMAYLYDPDAVPMTEANKRYWHHRALARVRKEELPSRWRHPILRYKAGKAVKKAKIRKARQDALAMGDFSVVDV